MIGFYLIVALTLIMKQLELECFNLTIGVDFIHSLIFFMFSIETIFFPSLQSWAFAPYINMLPTPSPRWAEGHLSI